MKSKQAIVVTTALAVALAGGGFAVGRETRDAITPNGKDLPVVSPSQNRSFPSFADLAARVSPAVVNVKVTSVEKTAFLDQLSGRDFPFPGFQIPVPKQPQEFRRSGNGVRIYHQQRRIDFDQQPRG